MGHPPVVNCLPCNSLFVSPKSTWVFSTKRTVTASPPIRRPLSHATKRASLRLIAEARAPKSSQTAPSQEPQPTAVTAGTTATGVPSPPPKFTSREHLEGAACLLFVAVLWGSYAPALKYVYELPGGPSPLVLTALRGLMQCGLLLAANWLWPAGELHVAAEVLAADPQVEPYEALLATSPYPHRHEQQHQHSQEGLAELQGRAEEQRQEWQQWQQHQQQEQQRRQQPLMQQQRLEQQQQQQQQQQPPPWSGGQQGREAGPAAWLRQLAAAAPPAVLGGLEIGVYNTIGTTMQAVGLAYTSATRASFLAQATSIFTPVLVAWMGDNPRPTVWAGSVLALAGAVLVAAEGAGGAQGGAPGEAALVGDSLVALAALAYSLATVRIAGYARQVAPLQLALGKSATLAVVSTALLGWDVAGVVLAGQPLGELWPNCSDPLAWGVIAYSAIGPGALAAFYHVKGQSLVSPTEAQIIFSSVPLWSVLLAALLLQEEGGGLNTWLGGAAMVAAGVVAAL